MNIDVKVGNPIPVEVWKSTYEIAIKYMHGDADAYTDDAVHFEVPREDNEFNMDLCGLLFMASEEFLQIHDADTERKALESMLPRMGFDKAGVEVFIDRYLQKDCTDNSWTYNAAISSLKVFYFNADGVKHECTVTIDGKPI